MDWTLHSRPWSPLHSAPPCLGSPTFVSDQVVAKKDEQDQHQEDNECHDPTDDGMVVVGGRGQRAGICRRVQGSGQVGCRPLNLQGEGASLGNPISEQCREIGVSWRMDVTGRINLPHSLPAHPQVLEASPARLAFPQSVIASCCLLANAALNPRWNRSVQGGRYPGMDCTGRPLAPCLPEKRIWEVQVWSPTCSPTYRMGMDQQVPSASSGMAQVCPGQGQSLLGFLPVATVWTPSAAHCSDHHQSSEDPVCTVEPGCSEEESTAWTLGTMGTPGAL